ncbi:DUF6480 family protein [Dietzia psychralcaliphila]|uniref:Uncharacterized protein n=1 Tax=Dietzia psychralcaliphila TaxID=139021 RepID=A0AAD0NQP1_9ACTN|nr:DUF6480 family protein [Dietzia psychralcaliphila]AWH96314.1 hypothetical protein A6048_13310 [Dietzia psychralcaliphila]PTM90588.1 hypothetical protein C8N39_101341 [Dietzia psychralcaliphila]
MTHARPSDPDPADTPDVDSAGSPDGMQTPASDSTSMQSDSKTMKQSPTPLPSKKGAYISIFVIALIVLLLVVGLAGYAFEVF